MQLISTNASLKSQLSRLIKQYPNIALGTAWASAATEVFEALVHGRHKVSAAVIGTHFYQTHPDVLESFIDSSTVKFVLQPDGVFHPKVYAFWNEHSWEVLIGSANLTAGAMRANTELTTLISHKDGTPGLKDEVLALIARYSAMARTVTKDDADRYRRIWNLKQPELRRLAGQYGQREAKRLAVDSPVMSMAWPQFFKRIKEDKTHGFEDRIFMLEAVRKVFDATPHFNDMPPQVRLGIAGLESKFLPNPKWFGSMTGAGTFYKLVNNREPAFSIALDAIPRTGAVTKVDYNRYIAEYLKAYPNGRDGLGTATRLLSMKRPDTFLCVDAANLKALSKDVGMKRPDKLDYERYWDEVVLRLMDSPWWQSPEPTSLKERAAWRGRAAMLDAIFYRAKKAV